MHKLAVAGCQRTSVQLLLTVKRGTRFVSFWRYLQVSAGSGNAASTVAMHSFQVMGSRAAIVCMLASTSLCFFFEDTRGPLLRSVLN